MVNDIMKVGMSFYTTTTKNLYDRPLWRLKEPPKRIRLKYRLARFMWHLLNKWGLIEMHFETVDEYTYTQIDKDNVVKAVSDAVIQHMDFESGREYAVMMGEKNFYDLMKKGRNLGGAILDGGDYFYQPPRLPGYEHLDPTLLPRGEIFGLPVHVVRGLEGVAVVPRGIIFKEIRYGRT